MRRILVGSLLLVLLLVAGVAGAQEQTAVLQGTVSDASGSALPGVTVEAVSSGGQRFSTTTDEAGRYRFPSIPPGSYSVTATLSGMDPRTVRNVAISLGSSPKVDVTLGLAAVAESMTVTADAPLVDVTSNAAQTSVTTETIERLPHGRDFASVVTIAPSANENAKTGGISIDGATGSENRYIMDGVDTTNPQTGVQGKVLVTEFVEEVQVKAGGYQAEFGGATGGVINVITKTGTNDVRGSAGVTYNDRAWGGDPRPVLQLGLGSLSSQYEQFTARKDENTLVEPGVSLGGPILKDRLWFYAGYQPWTQNIRRTVDFLNTDRTVRATRSFDQGFTRNNLLGNLSGAIGSRFLYKAAYNDSGYETDNTLPGVSGRGNENADYSVNDELENWAASGYADLVATPKWFFSARGGRFHRNYSTSPTSSDVDINFLTGSPGATVAGGARLFPEIPESLLRSAGYSNVPTNSRTLRDLYERDNLNLDVSWFPQFAGAHRFKAGVQIDNIANDVFSGNQNYVVDIAWNGTCAQCSTRGKYGSAGVYVFETSGEVTSENLGLFVQDSWTTFHDRLTLNVGVRTEQEKVPAYNNGTGIETTGEFAIKFDFKDKLAPRLGAAFDVFGNGRTKVFASYGTYYDIVKLEMPRGAFGGAKWLYWNFNLDDYDWTKWSNCTGVSNNRSVRPACPGMSLQGAVDLRHASNTAAHPLVDPDLKPMENREISLGFQQDLTRNTAVGFRYVNKSLVRGIEDVGVLVVGADGIASEEFFIANPGEGVARKILSPNCPTCPAMPNAKRDYQGYEVEFTRRFGGHWSAHASYLYSQLKGNYSGLANSDEVTATAGTARTAPNVNRIFDSLFMLYDQQGGVVEGPLGGDRPHSFKGQAAYAFDFGTTVGVSQYYYSGTPTTTEMRFQSAPIFPFGRNDMGRTPSITQTDLNLTHHLRLGRFDVQLGGIVLNLFDEKKATNIYPIWSTTSILLRQNGCVDTSSTACVIGGPVSGAARNNAQAAAFFAGFDAVAQRNRQVALGLVPDPRYGQPNAYQDPREVRIFAKLTF